MPGWYDALSILINFTFNGISVIVQNFIGGVCTKYWKPQHVRMDKS